MQKFNYFLNKKDIEFSLKRYGIDAMGSMTYGLFSSLIVGLILRELGVFLSVNYLIDLGEIASSKYIVGSAIGVSVAYALKSPQLVLFTSVMTGFLGYDLGGPVGSFLSSALSTEIGKAASKETKLDIIVTPVCMLLSGGIISIFIGPPINQFMLFIGNLIDVSTNFMPVLMGGVVAIVMGMVLTSPLSSAALAIMMDLNGLSAGAACAGCCAQMIGFATSSYRENKISGAISQGIGTSMLQISNIIKNPFIWVPPTVASAICGGLSVTVFKMENIASGAGMGTSGLVGQIGTFAAMGYSFDVFMKLLLLHFIIPVIISFVVSEFMRKRGFINFGDSKLQNL